MRLASLFRTSYLLYVCCLRNAICIEVESLLSYKSCPKNGQLNTTSIKCIPYPNMQANHSRIQRWLDSVELPRQVTVVIDSKFDSYELLYNGSLVLKHFGKNITLGETSNCTDSEEIRVFLLCPCRQRSCPLDRNEFNGALEPGNVTAVLLDGREFDCCKDSEDSPESDTEFHQWLFPVSATFLALTLIVFVAVPATRTSKTYLVVFHIVCLLVVYVFFAVYRLYEGEVWPGLCYGAAFVDQFFNLASSLWINVLCFDIARSFSVFQLPVKSGRKKLVHYSLYAWGCPTIITGVTAAVEFVEGIPASIIKPNIDVEICEYTNPLADWVYIYGPILVVAFLNFLLLLYSVVKLVLAQCSTSVLNTAESGRHNGSSKSSNSKRLILYFNLLCLMGPPRIALILTWAVAGASESLEYFEDVTDLLRAISIFVFVCCRPQVPAFIAQRLRNLSHSLSSQSTGMEEHTP